MAGDDLGQPFFGQLLAAEARHSEARRHADHRGDREGLIRASHLLQRQHRFKYAKAHAAVLFGERDRHHAEIAELFEQCGREDAVAIELLSHRRHLGLSEITDARL